MKTNLKIFFDTISYVVIHPISYYLKNNYNVITVINISKGFIFMHVSNRLDTSEILFTAVSCE